MESMAVFEVAAGLLKPRTSLASAAIHPNGSGFPQILRGMIEVEDAHSHGLEELIEDAPEAASAIAEPDPPWWSGRRLADKPRARVEV